MGCQFNVERIDPGGDFAPGSPQAGIVTALHSPGALLETGLRMCRSEKSKESDRIRIEESNFGRKIYAHDVLGAETRSM
jgi:hypothetical protein